ncbi:hypothetical protein [Geobacter sp.]|uniref:hypothetical protein n=1 Tax=Geobacter sp. TaxID=46610 RepID=UPI0026355AD2|nr:hypothetical protein [Geobacter sp.]
MTPNHVQVIFEAINRFSNTFGVLGAELGTLRGRVALVSAEFTAVKMAVETVFNGIAAALQPGIDAVENFQASVVKTAAMITSFQGNKGDISENYRKAHDYAEALQSKLEEVDVKTIASAQDLSLITEEMLKQRVLLDINSQKQVDGFVNIANAVATVTQGAGAKEIQIRQEVRALMLGQVDAQSQLASQVNAMVGGGLKQKVALWKQEGTLVENIGGLLVGYAAASGDIQSLWSTIKSTMSTIANQILRGGFTQAFGAIVGSLQRMGDYLKEHKSDIQGVIRKAWLAVKGTLETVKSLLDTQWVLLKRIAGLVAKIFDDWGMLLYVVLPPLADRFSHLLSLLNAIVNVGYAFGMIMLDSVGAVGEAIAKIGKAAWQALTGDFDEAQKTLGGMFAGAFVERLKDDAAVIKGAMLAAGEEWQALKDPFGEMGRRYDEYQKKINASKKSAATPTLPAAPLTKEQLQEARAAEESRLKVELEGYKASQEQQSAVLKRREAEVEEYYKSGVISEREFQEWKRQLQEEGINNEIALLREQEVAQRASWEKRKGLFFSDEGRERIKAAGDVAAEIKKIDAEIAKKREELATIGVKGRIDEIDYSRKLTQTERDGVLKVLEEEIGLQKQKNELLAEEGTISPLELKERELALDRQLLQAKIRKLEIDRQQSLTDAEKAAKAAEVETLRRQLEGLAVRGTADTLPYGDFFAGFAKGMKAFADKARQTFTLGADMARETAQAMNQAFSDFFFDMMQGKFKNLGEVFVRFLSAIQRSIANVLAQLATEGLIKKFGSFFMNLFNGSGDLEFIDAGPQTKVAHQGGLILHAGGLVPRLHFGGLASDEVPAILQTRERVLSREQNALFEKFVNKADNPAGVNVSINLENKSGQPLEAKTGGMRFDGRRFVIDVVLDSINGYGDLYHAMKGVR